MATNRTGYPVIDEILESIAPASAATNTEQPVLDIEGEADGPRRYLHSELEHAFKTQALLVEALRAIRIVAAPIVSDKESMNTFAIWASQKADAALKAAGVEEK
jgi:hypothetical protein